MVEALGFTLSREHIIGYRTADGIGPRPGSHGASRLVGGVMFLRSGRVMK